MTSGGFLSCFQLLKSSVKVGSSEASRFLYCHKPSWCGGSLLSHLSGTSSSRGAGKELCKSFPPPKFIIPFGVRYGNYPIWKRWLEMKNLRASLSSNTSQDRLGQLIESLSSLPRSERELEEGTKGKGRGGGDVPGLCHPRAQQHSQAANSLYLLEPSVCRIFAHATVPLPTWTCCLLVIRR